MSASSPASPASRVVGLINLRSDTQSLPTAQMRRAMADAELGDETYDEDPTVLRLEERVVALTGQESALLVLSGTMANLVAVMSHCQPGDEILVPEAAHILMSEAAGVSRVAGCLPTVVPSERGHVLPQALTESAVVGDVTRPTSRLLWIENTHNRAGGSVLPIAGHDRLVAAARTMGLSVHVDGARLPNAAAACEVPIERFTASVDSVYLDFTKGLGCPMGAMLAGSAAFVEQARRQRRVLGGGMRQAGVIAAAALVALDTELTRIPEDHATARLLAAELASCGLFGIDLARVETNFVPVDTSRIGPASELADRLAAAGVLVSIRPPHQLRLVTYRQIGPAEVHEAAERMIRVAAEMAGEAA